MGVEVTREQSVIPSWKNLEALHFSVGVPAVMLLALLVFPWKYSWVFMGGMFLLHMHVCFTLTFDGFMRFSRYRLSQQNPILDMVVSNAFIVLCFFGFSPLALFLKSYSLRVSPDSAAAASDLPFYARSFFKPLVQGIILLGAVLVLVFK